MMKKTFLYVLAVIAAALCLTSCQQEEPTFDEALLIGKWQEVGTQVFYTYASDYTGKTWDEADDVTEAEAQPFEWSLVQSTLTQIHIMTVGGNVPKTYTVTQLTSSKLVYEDATTEEEFSFNKVN